jgi:thymidine kinase
VNSEETPYHQKVTGRIEVITGPMFSGKTEELIRRLNRAKLAKLNVETFKPSMDKRYSETEIVSHNSTSLNSITVSDPEEILKFTSEIAVVGIDEAQFFNNQLIEVCNILANKGVRVIVAGLDMDFRAQPFGPIPSLCAVAESVTKLSAICMKCGNAAHYSHRISDKNELILLGEKNEYEPLCRSCYYKIYH